VRFVITNYLAVRDLSVFWAVLKLHKEACACSWDIMDALKKDVFVAKTQLPKWLKVWVLHEGNVFHFLACYWMDHCIGEMMLLSMVCSQGNGYVCCFHAPKTIL
jgi:hypothetical protein